MHLSLEQVPNLCPPSRSESPLAAYGSFLRSFGHLKKNVTEGLMDGQMDGGTDGRTHDSKQKVMK